MYVCVRSLPVTTPTTATPSVVSRGTQLQETDSGVYALHHRIKVTPKGIPLHQRNILPGRGQRADCDMDHPLPLQPEGSLVH